MVHPPCCPKLGLLSSVSLARVREMWPMVPSSQEQVRGAQVALQVARHHRQNPDLKVSVDQMTLH